MRSYASNTLYRYVSITNLVFALCTYSVTTFSACRPPNKDSTLLNYLESEYGITKDRSPKAIFLITEDGCKACNRGFSDQLRQWVDLKSCLFIIRADGSTINLNGFLDETENIRYDDGSFGSLGLLEGSGMIVLNGGKIDSIIPLTTDDYGDQIIFVNSFLDSLSQSAP